MPTGKKPSTREPGLLIDVARVVSVGRDRTTGQVVLRFRDERGRIAAVMLRSRQFLTLAASDDRRLERRHG